MSSMNNNKSPGPICISFTLGDVPRAIIYIGATCLRTRKKQGQSNPKRTNQRTTQPPIHVGTTSLDKIKFSEQT